MKTHCPQCHTPYEVSPEQLHQHEGIVRCGVCDTVFNAVEYAQDAIPRVLPQGNVPMASHRSVPMYREERDDRDARYQEERYSGERYQASDDRDDTPRYTRDQPRSFWVFWIVGIFVLAIALFFQGVVVYRQQLVKVMPSSRNLIMQVCSIAGCQLNEPELKERIKLSHATLKVRPDVRPQAGMNALLLQVTVSNTSAEPTPWPSLFLSLKNMVGAVEYSRLLSPSDYLGKEKMTPTIAPFSSVVVNVPFTIEGVAPANFELGIYFFDNPPK